MTGEGFLLVCIWGTLLALVYIMVRICKACEQVDTKLWYIKDTIKSIESSNEASWTVGGAVANQKHREIVKLMKETQALLKRSVKDKATTKKK